MQQYHFLKAQTVLCALCMGLTVTIGSRDYVMDINGELCVAAQNVTTSENVLLKVDFGISLANFIALCETATDYEIGVIAANIGLNKLPSLLTTGLI